jgi:2-polyprenyl-6-methoxyphenol hydroxylase-like FAD-dependent oxidoreductase
MAGTRPFRVIVGGGGISGLTLANALEKANVDYILLEGRDTIAPQVGASIGLFPNGGRILDQLGCLEEVEAETVPLELYHNRYENGKLIYTADSIPLIQKRCVFTAIFTYGALSGVYNSYWMLTLTYV